MNNNQAQEVFLEAEAAIRGEVRKSGIEFAELSPFIRELLAKIYIRGGIEAIEKLKRGQKDLLEKPKEI